MYREQLQFNLNTPSKRGSLQTNFQKPRPIVIEKLAPAKPPEPTLQRPSSNNSLLSSLSSERLEFAMQLAKRDVKKLKTMLSDPSIQMPDILQKVTDRQVGVDHQQSTEQQAKVVLQRSVSTSQPKKEKNMNVGKVLSSKKQIVVKSPKDVNYKNGQLKFIQFDENKDIEVEDEKPQGKEVTEIKRLRKELHKYMKRLDSVLDEKGNDFQGKAKGVRSLVDEDTEKERKRVRAEEQASRSARVLYMLQRKVQEIQDELEKQDDHVKHTRKSQHLTRLAAAHRSAVRALQMFVNQAPLYFDVKHGLPPMYQELALLIQQLSLLSSQLHVGKDVSDFNMDLLPKTKKLISNWTSDTPNKTTSVKSTKSLGQQKIKNPPTGKQNLKQEQKLSFLDQHSDWLRDKARDMRIGDVAEQSTTSNEPTPEREAVLKAGLDALKRARESSSFVATDIKQRPSGVSFQIPKPTVMNKRRPKSVLFPHQIKKQRYQSAPTRPKVKPVTRPSQGPTQPMHFAKQTVASILKKQDEIKFEPKKRVPLSPRQVQTEDHLFTAYESPKQRDRRIIENASTGSKRDIPRSDVSPKAIRSLDFLDERNHQYDSKSPQYNGSKSPSYDRMGPRPDGVKSPRYDPRIMEKEVARQAWLDRERDRELRRLEDLRSRESLQLHGLRHEYVKSQKLIDDAEEKIKKTLQPLLEKAEFISYQEKLRNDQYKQSVRKRLGEIVTETAMSKGELLAEMILDDILVETVNELQRIEQQEFAESQAIFQSEKPTVDNVKKRLEEFEKEEEEIRRRWKALHYSELHTANESKHIAKGVTDAVSAKPIVFTAVQDEWPKLQTNDDSQHNKGNLPQSSKVTFPARDSDVVPSFVPDQMRKSILAYKEKSDSYLRRTLSEKHGKFDPCKLVERISEEILEEVILEVGNELDNICDDYVETIYADEFVRNDSLISQTSNDTITKSNSY